MARVSESLDPAVVQQQCKVLRMPTVAAQCEALAKQAARENQSHVSYLIALLGAEIEERDRHVVARRIKEARFPRVKTLEEYDFSKAPHISPTLILELAGGGYIDRSEPVVFIGEPGTGKTHLATGLSVAAARQKRRVRFTTATALINELVEAQAQNMLGRALQRWARYDVIVIDEVGYVPFAELGSELFYQVISERAERAALIITTNLAFSEWTQVFPAARLCKAILDRVTDRAHIVDTGTESHRFRRTLERKKKKKD
jgi:DNA replication protein DnaC